MRILTSLIALALIAVGVSFASLNADPVTINYYIGQAKLPLSLLLALFLAAGGMLGIAVCLPTIIRLKTSKRLLKRKLKQLSKKVEG